MNAIFQDALQGKKTERFPIWLMRQAGRYLPEYRALREKHSLLTLFETPELIAEVTHLPLPIIKPDAAILFSDITMPARLLGLDLDFQEGIGPIITPKVRSVKDLKMRPGALSFIEKAIRDLKKSLLVPLIGFCGAPFTLSCYLTEHRAKDFKKKWLYQDPKGFHAFLRVITDVTKDYLEMQIEAGADAIQIFESWGHLLPRSLFKSFALPYIQELIDFVKERKKPVIVFARGACLYKEELIEAKPSAVSFDWGEDLAYLRKTVPKEIAVQGNFDPDLLYASFSHIENTVKDTLGNLDPEGCIINLGHGLKPDMDPEKVKHFVQTVRNYGRFGRSRSEKNREVQRPNSSLHELSNSPQL